jgi:hypothetical protein
MRNLIYLALTLAVVALSISQHGLGDDPGRREAAGHEASELL